MHRPALSGCRPQPTPLPAVPLSPDLPEKVSAPSSRLRTGRRGSMELRSPQCRGGSRGAGGEDCIGFQQPEQAYTPPRTRHLCTRDRNARGQGAVMAVVAKWSPRTRTESRAVVHATSDKEGRREAAVWALRPLLPEASRLSLLRE